MYLADYHTHTQFSPDAQDSMTAMAQAAIRAACAISVMVALPSGEKRVCVW